MRNLNETTPPSNTNIKFTTDKGVEVSGKYDGAYFVSESGQYFSPEKVQSWSNR